MTRDFRQRQTAFRLFLQELQVHEKKSDQLEIKQEKLEERENKLTRTIKSFASGLT
jgi:hypothetical protein